MVVSHLKLIIEYMKINIATAMEYRFNFIVQSLSMVANNAIWILFWWIFFQKFNIVNTWKGPNNIWLNEVWDVSNVWDELNNNYCVNGRDNNYMGNSTGPHC